MNTIFSDSPTFIAFFRKLFYLPEISTTCLNVVAKKFLSIYYIYPVDSFFLGKIINMSRKFP
jgi:hypothetical protein